MDEEGQIWDLDYNGPGVYSMDCRPHWRFKVLPLQTAGPQLPSNHAKYHYDILQNLNWVYAKLGLKFSLYQTGSYHKNCVGLIADAYGRPDWAALAPGDFEKLSL